MANTENKLYVNELLFFIQNKLHSTTKDAVVEMCVKFYSFEEIKSAASLLETVHELRLPKRNKSDDTPLKIMTKHVADLYERLKSLDNNSTRIQFLAADLTRLPREQENSDSLASPEQLLASIVSLRRTVTHLQSQMISRDFFESSLARLTGCNFAPSASTEDFPPLAPPPLPPPHGRPLTPSAPVLSQSSSAAPSAPPTPASTSSASEAALAPTLSASAAAAADLAPSSSAINLHGRRRNEVVDRQRGKVGQKPSSAGEDKRPSNKRDRNSPIVIGKNVNSGLMSIKGADLMVARYIGRLALDTTAEQIRASLVERKVDVVSCDPIPSRRNHPSFTSFKLVVKRSQLPIIERDDFWPDGVIVGRYWAPKTTETDAAATAAAAAAPAAAASTVTDNHNKI